MILIILLFVFFSGSVRCMADEKNHVFLILGINSGIINEIQDRIIREKVMSDFIGNKLQIIPVMELTGYLIDNNVNIRNLDDSKAVLITNDLDADVCFYYAFTDSNRLTINMYDKSKNRFKREISVFDSFDSQDKMLQRLTYFISKFSLNMARSEL